MIAPYFSDVDTRGTGNIWYRSTLDPVLLEKAKNDIPMVLSGPNFNLTWLFIATWDHVGYYNTKTDKVIITAECMYMHAIYTDINITRRIELRSMADASDLSKNYINLQDSKITWHLCKNKEKSS